MGAAMEKEDVAVMLSVAADVELRVATGVAGRLVLVGGLRRALNRRPAVEASAEDDAEGAGEVVTRSYGARSGEGTSLPCGNRSKSDPPPSSPSCSDQRALRCREGCWGLALSMRPATCIAYWALKKMIDARTNGIWLATLSLQRRLSLPSLAIGAHRLRWICRGAGSRASPAG